jgi:hypothetical protein
MSEFLPYKGNTDAKDESSYMTGLDLPEEETFELTPAQIADFSGKWEPALNELLQEIDREALMMDACEAFAGELKKAGHELNISELKCLADNLIEYASCFDIEGVQKYLNTYDQFNERIAPIATPK